jgi:ligand-binding sensor domain-containing protein/class 3 adenylate cyclase
MTIWTDREGLPSDTILDVAQDHSGYIWLASYDGLVRFDGEKFSVLSAAEDGFDGKSARVLEIAPDGTLWIGTNTSGLYSYRKGKFIRYGIEEGLPDLSVRSLAIDADGIVWVGTANGVSKKNGDRFESAVPANSASFGIANFLLPLHDGTVIVGSNLPGLWLITAKGVEPYLANQGISAWSFSAAILDHSGQLWLGTSSGQIIRVSRNEIREKYEPSFLKGSSINTFYTDSEGTLWIGTDRGVLCRRGNEFESFTEENGLPSDVVSSLCRDTEGSLWVGTERGGLVKFSQGKFVNTTEREGLISNAVNAVTEDRYRSVWAATDEGVSFFPSVSDPYKSDATRRFNIDSLVARLKGVRVRQIRAEKDGSLWFSTYSDDGLIALKADGTTSVTSKGAGLPTNRVRFTFRTSKGDLWIGTTAGPVMISNGKMTVFGKDSGLPNLFILGISEDGAGNIWLGTDGGGIAVWNGRSFKILTRNDGLAGNVVFRVFHDSQDRLWACTSDGLSLYDGTGFRSADASLGISGQSAYEILEDRSGRLWIITARSVIVASASDLASAVNSGTALANFRSYDRLDGLAGQLSANAWAFMNSSGIVYLPTLKGFSTYNPQSVSMNMQPPPVIIEKVTLDRTKAELGSKQLQVDAGVRRVTFFYTALSFVIPQRVRFQYRLDGYDRDWISAGTGREIGYTNLPPGNYTFRVKAENNDGVVNEEGALISFYKRPFFYQTIPFYALVAVLLVLAGFLSAYLRVRVLARRAKELNALVNERTRELAEEKDKTESLLLNILPPTVAEELKQTGRSTPQVYEKTAVLFADIVGFTALSETLGPEELIRELNDIFTAFDTIMEKRGCERIKTLGDGYLACCGLPVADSDCARKLVRAAIDMLVFLEDRNLTAGNRLEIRIGVDSGSIVGGVVGVKKYIFDVFGDTVNMAFRLESMSVPMGLTVSDSVAKLLGKEFRLIERPGRIVKGKGILPSYYVCYRESWPKVMSNDEALAAYSKGLKLFGEGKIDECRALIESFDYTTLEPEVGYDLYQLASRAWNHAGDAESARKSLLRAECFRS